MSLIKKAIEWGTGKSPWIIHFNAGACNGCDIETIDALTPRYDLERVGIVKQGSPRHADVLVCTGAVTLQTRERLIQIYDQMSDPKFVIAIGTCACTGGIFKDCYCVTGGIDTVIPVDVYIPGCAVRPEAIISAVDKLLSSLGGGNEKAENTETGGGDTDKAEKTAGNDDKAGESDKTDKADKTGDTGIAGNSDKKGGGGE